MATTSTSENGSSARTGPWTEQVNALGDFIRAQRQLANLSLREMASLTSVSNAYLSQVERGLHQPSLKVLRSIADALQLSTEQLLSQAGWSTAEPAGPAAAGPGPQPAPGAAATSAPASTEDAIRADARLTEDQKAALLGVLRSFVDGATPPR
ncbi:helix-turn-helix domain-containing protein [Pseudonocardia benzenivorans]|jgi:transcriptional regulator with XRE-family HTH domain|uniref:Helix-turn-helix domain protein n=2 Tax=Pseudonocardia TaxID=1847 RepID=F4CR89_PSEUX|nr:helix-turn-helix transcriptional regulator [Pseudonocardia dioxanivorans]AEA25180.1 helix-turn-helix domain protein [Pseudonocardia dioxanivorans CB1190]GJF03960.1 hypothetical protein PSD17_29180 [Pseudonocardia sp. D17]